MSLREDQSVWDKELDRELSEALEEHEAGAEERNKEYEQRLEEWKQTHSERSSVLVPRF